MRNTTFAKLFCIALVLTFAVSLCYSEPIDTSFTYQGQLKELGDPAMGLYDFVFTLYDADINGSQIGDALLLEDVVVSNGLFSILLDFGQAPFDGNIYWLQLEVKPRDMNDFTNLMPRQEINPAPYAVYAKTAGNAGNIDDIITGTGTANYIAKYLDPNTLIESIIYESGGNIGIGTASPDESLHVVGNIRATGALIGAVDWTNLVSVPAGLDDGDDVGITVETDPTVLASVKDGVSWSELSSVPSGFADGVDDIGVGAETDPTVAASVKDGVTWLEVSSRPAGLDDGDDNTQLSEAQVDAYVANNGFLDGSSALDWNNITIDMPAGFADGIDNEGSGGEDADWTISDSNMYSAVSGNVGIGTTNPSEILDVNGNTHITGNLTVDGEISGLGTPHGSQVFTSSGTFTVPSGVTKVYLTMVGGGGGGGSSDEPRKTGGGGGGGEACVVMVPYTVTPSSSYTVIVGAGGAGGTSGNQGSNGGTSSFDVIISVTGGAGGSEGYDGAGAGGTGSGGVIVGTDGKSSSQDGQAGGLQGYITFAGGAGGNGTGTASDWVGDGGGGGGTMFGAGAQGGAHDSGSNGSDATANTGAGGGGSGPTASGGAGGSGIVIVEW